jgi:hypothetical protein
MVACLWISIWRFESSGGSQISFRIKSVYKLQDSLRTISYPEQASVINSKAANE